MGGEQHEDDAEALGQTGQPGGVDPSLPYLPPARPVASPGPMAPVDPVAAPPLPAQPAPTVPDAPPVVPGHSPPMPGAPASPPDGPPDDGLLPADRIATRNVPAARQTIDYGIELKQATTQAEPPGTVSPSDATAPQQPVDPRTLLGLPAKPVTPKPFVRPELESMGPSTTAMLIGRGLMAIAALLVGVAAQRATGLDAAERGEAFWPVVLSAGVFVLVAFVGLVYWSAVYAENGQRLQARAAGPRAVLLSWAVPVGWVAFSALTYLRIDVGGGFDPLPGVAGVGFAIALAIPHGRLRGLFRRMSRRSPAGWWFAYLLDLAAFGLVWWRLTDWPSPVASGDAEHVRLTANVAFGAAGLLAVNALVFAALAQLASQSVYDRLGRLEARHSAGDDATPAWHRTGMQVGAQPAPVVNRPLINTGPLSAAVAGFHVLWGIATIVFAVAMARLAFGLDDGSLFLGGESWSDDDLDRLVVAAAALALVYVATIVVHAVWGTLVALNARRVTVHAPSPASFGVLFTPMPVLVIAGLVIGGWLGEYLVFGGLGFAFVGLVLLNRMLGALTYRLGEPLQGFNKWTGVILAVYLVGLAERFIFGGSIARPGFIAAASLVQGALIVVGGVVGYRAMRSLEEMLASRRQVRRAGPS